MEHRYLRLDKFSNARLLSQSTILSVCRVSRAFFLRHSGYSLFNIGLDVLVYMNHSIDTLYFSYFTLFKTTHYSDLKVMIG